MEIGSEPASGYRFAVGDCVSHKDQAMPSLVMSRQLCGKGIEVYGVRSFAAVDPVRDRIMLGDCLRVPKARDCEPCLLSQTGLCPRRVAS